MDHGSEGRGFESCLSQTSHWARVLVHPGSKHRERLSISSEHLFRNRCKINMFKPIEGYPYCILISVQEGTTEEGSKTCSNQER